MAKPIGLPVVPGQFWVKGWVHGHDGKMPGRTSHALVHALSALHAASGPTVELMRERLEEGLPPGEYCIEFTVHPVKGEEATLAEGY